MSRSHSLFKVMVLTDVHFCSASWERNNAQFLFIKCEMHILLLFLNYYTILSSSNQLIQTKEQNSEKGKGGW